MKSIFKTLSFLVFFVFAFSGLNAQTEINTGFSQAMQTVFGNIDRSQVPYGILRDYGMEFTNLENYSGTVALADSNYADDHAFWEVYNTLASARIHTNATGFLDPGTIDNRWFNYRQPGQITLAGEYFNYAYYGSSASNNVTISNNQVYDKYVNGTWQNPYQSSQVFLISPSVTTYQGKSFAVVFPSDLWLTNSAGSVSSISVNFSDGNGYMALMPGSTVNLNYTDTGMKEWTYQLILTNSTVLYSHSFVVVQDAVTTGQGGGYTDNCVGCPTGGIPLTIAATQDYLGVYGQALISIHYGGTIGQLRKPLIVAEGFDQGHITMPERQFGETSIVTFSSAVSNSSSTDLQNLLNSDYDIVYVDWKNGTDYLQRNAYVLEEVIRWVNSHKDPLPGGGYEPNVVLGQSMGGVIARYALKDMENHGEYHQTRLYISWDAPHQGASVPEGYQDLDNHVKNLYLSTGASWVTELVLLLAGRPSITRELSLADEPASRQMLINRINSDNNNIDNSYHNSWQTELQAMGYPQGVSGIPFRMVAVSNGSECANPEPFNPGDNLLTYQGYGNTRFLTDLAGTMVSALAGTLVNPAFYLGILPGRNRLDFDFRLYAQADGSSNQVYKGKITYTKTILWLINVTITLTDRSFYSSASTLPYEYFPGGYYNVNDNLKGHINLRNQSVIDWLFRNNITASNQSYFCFVPTCSALDIGGGTTALSKADYLTSYVGGNPPASPKNTPFANFITAFPNSSLNEQHISIEKRNGDWVAAELNQTNPVADCSAFCNLQIIGGDLCNTGTYSVTVPAGTSVDWTLGSTNAVIVGSNVGSQVTLNATSYGPLPIYVNVYSPCGVFNISKTINSFSTPSIIGGYYTSNGQQHPLVPDPNLEYLNPVCDITHPVTSITTDMSFINATSVVWTKLYSQPTNLIWSQSDATNLTIGFKTISQTGYFKVDASNSCGTATQYYSFQSVSCNPSMAVAVTPNPASNYITVSMVTSSTADALNSSETNVISSGKSVKGISEITQAKIYAVKITDVLGKVRKLTELKIGVPSLTIPLTGMAPDVYFLSVFDGTNWSTQKIVVQ